ncbi:MAG: Gfo/Idh/MocA family oxidoreductase [candidate division NC10 bacterium]|nr:Gfo/Idh/MocA family oxidoreductase [candidate division NC10 bacterium]MDE2320826.1 Gfo/Idh/MocA family oxidoreductase [candidate division NC10 bacterium]
MLKGAIIGLGNVAVNGHLVGWEGCEQAWIVAAADALESRLAQERSRLPGARLYADVSAMLAAEAIDFVDICTPPGTHASLIRLALSRGLHVLCEKPLVLTPDELRLVGDARAESGRILHTVHNWRYAPIIMQATALIRQGQIGTVQYISWHVHRREPSIAVQSASGPVDSAVSDPSTMLRTGNWRLDPAIAGGGILLDHGYHALYIVLDWLGEAPRTITATLEKRRHPEWPVEDTANVRLRSSAAEVEILLTWASSSRSNRAVIEGTCGTIRIEDGTLVLKRDEGEQSWTFEEPLSQGSHHPEWFRQVRDEFLREISAAGRDGENLAMASRCVQLLHLAKESDSQGGKALAL